MASVLRVPGLEPDGLVYGFSTIEFGSVGLTHAKDPESVHAARRRFAEALALDPSTLTVAGAVHGAEVARVDTPQERIENVDALITDQPGIALFATYADCYPIVLYDPTHHAAGLVHAGWGGTEAQVATAALKAMANEFGTDPNDVQAGIGPGICGLCYEVGADVAGKFDARFVRPSEAGEAFVLDLAAANRAQLQEAGVRDIFTLDMCTKESSELPSHRRDHDGARFGAIASLRNR